MSRRKGFTLIELLVVISIIAVLMALLLPAVQSAREASRRAQCSNNLRQVGLAIQSYISTHESLPCGGISASPVPGAPTLAWAGWSAHAQLLPYLEQRVLYDMTNFSISCQGGEGGPINFTIRSLSLSVFLCPSDPVSGSDSGFTNNYLASVGTTTWINATETSGSFAFDRAYKLKSFTDGTSSTICFSEGLANDSSRPVTFTVNFQRADNLKSPRMLAPSLEQAIAGLQACYTNPGVGIVMHRRSGGWSQSRSGYTLFNHLQTPNEKTWGFSGCRDADPHDLDIDASFSQGASSSHNQGVNCLFVDGGVRWVKESVSRGVWMALGTKRGGEFLDAEAY